MSKPTVVFIELKIASKDRYVCDLAEKLYDNSIPVCIFVKDEKSAKNLDDMLWTWKQ